MRDETNAGGLHAKLSVTKNRKTKFREHKKMKIRSTMKKITIYN